MVLAKFSDDLYYRAVVLNVSETSASVNFIDYGGQNVISFEDIEPMPTSLMTICCAHTVQLRLKSGRPLGRINSKKTREMLEEKNDFSADVEAAKAQTGTGRQQQYIVYIDDSLVVY